MTVEEAEGLAAQAWSEPKTENIPMNMSLVEAFAKILTKETEESYARGWGDGWGKAKHDYTVRIENPPCDTALIGRKS